MPLDAHPQLLVPVVAVPEWPRPVSSSIIACRVEPGQNARSQILGKLCVSFRLIWEARSTVTDIVYDSGGSSVS